MIRCLPVTLSSMERKRAYLTRLGIPPDRQPELLGPMEGLCFRCDGVDPDTLLSLDEALRLRSGILAVGGEGSRILTAAPREAYTNLIREFVRGEGNFPRLLREMGACMVRMDREPSLCVGDRDLFRDRQSLLMGILNVTPDSFYDGGRCLDSERAVEHGVKLSEEGAHILDVGAESSRPGSDPIPAEEEMARLLPVLEGLRQSLSDAVLSVDTVKAEVARAALDAGADLINDISAGRYDPEMIPLAAEKKVPIVLMHMRGLPKTMQESPRYEDPVFEVVEELRVAVKAAEAAGVDSGKIVVDPGIGFGKRPADNLDLLDSLPSLKSLGYPVLVGASRKSLIGHVTGAQAEDRLPGTLALHLLATLNGANILRVHDVREHAQALRMLRAVQDGIPRGSEG